MEKLPPTSYIRMVDIWLIFAQLIPFIEVIFLTLLELYNNSGVTNHHGFERSVPRQTSGKWTLTEVLHIKHAG